jgi:hypothetical protein
MTISQNPGDQQGPDGEATRGLAEAMRWWTLWTLRWTVAGLMFLLVILIISGTLDAF